jgi:hypothetical protein
VTKVVFLIFLLFAGASFPQTRIVIEAEDMKGVERNLLGPGKDWQTGEWGRVLYQNMTFGGVWQSRLKTVMTDEKDNSSEIYSDLEIPETKNYKVWVKYECPPFYNYAFGVRIVDEGKKEVLFDKTYGLIESPKHFSFKKDILRGSLYWTWGIDHDAAEGYEVDLKKGIYRIYIYKTKNPPPAGPRSIDVVFITDRITELSSPDYPRYPLLDELRKTNKAYFRFSNPSESPLKLRWTRWAHRYPDFYYPATPKEILFYDEEGDAKGKVKLKDLIEVDGKSKTLWYNFGPVMNVESNSVFSFMPVENIEKAKFRIEVSLNRKEVIKEFEFQPEKGEKELSFVLQPDINTKEGQIYSKKVIDIYRDITKELAREERIGPIPEKLKLFASTGGASVLYKGEIPWDFDVTQEFRYALGLNTIPGNTFNKGYIDKMVEWREDRKAPLIKRSLSYHHNQNIKDVVKRLNDKRLNDYFHYLSYGDEIGLPRINPEDKGVVDEFINFLKEEGVTPQKLGLKGWEDVRPLNSVSPDAAVKIGVVSEDEKESETAEVKMKKLYWYTLRFQEKKGIETFAEKTKELRENLGKEVNTTANLGGMHPFYWVSQTSFIESFKKNAMTIAWSEPYAWAMPEASNLVVDFEASYLRKGASYHNTPMMFYCMPHFPGNTPENFLQTAVILWMNNVKDLEFFCAGPDAFFTENYISYRYGIDMFKMIRKISGISGLIEKDILPAMVKETPVAFLVSQASDVWETAGKGQREIKPNSEGTNIFQEERKSLWYALRRAGYRVDILTENDVKEGIADRYRVIYSAGSNTESKAGERLKKWVERGGRLFLTSAAGRKDEFDQRSGIIDEISGRGKQTDFKQYAGPLRAKLELLFEEKIDEVSIKDESMDIYCVKENFTPSPDVTIISRYKDGKPSFIKKRYGKGTVYYSGFLPGITYVKKGMRQLPMGKGGGDQSFCHSAAHHLEIENPDKMAESIILLPLIESGIKPDVSAQDGIVTGRLESSLSTVIPVVNLKQKRLEDIEIAVKDVKMCRGVWSPFFKRGLKYRTVEGGIVVRVPEIGSADILIIKK